MLRKRQQVMLNPIIIITWHLQNIENYAVVRFAMLTYRLIIKKSLLHIWLSLIIKKFTETKTCSVISVLDEVLARQGGRKGSRDDG